MKQRYPKVLQIWANQGGDNGLRNGSFVRRTEWEDKEITLALYMNGDFIDFIEAVPEGYQEVTLEHANTLLPDCCKTS